MKKNLISLALFILVASVVNTAHARGRQEVTPELENRVMAFVGVMTSVYQAYQVMPFKHDEYEEVFNEREKYKRIKDACERASKVYALAPDGSKKPVNAIRFQEMSLEQNSLESSKRTLHNILVKNSKESLALLSSELPGKTNLFWSGVGADFRDDLLFYARSIEADIWLKRYDNCAKKIGNILQASKAVNK